MADTKVFLSGGRIQGRSDDFVVGADVEIVLDDDPSSPYSWGSTSSDYAPCTPSPSNENNYNGVQLLGGSALIGKKVKKIKAWLAKVGSPDTNGLIRLGILSDTNTGSTITWITGAYVDIEDLISGESGGVTLPAVGSAAVPIEITLPTPHTLEAYDTIGLACTGGNYGSGNNVAWNYSDGNGVYDGQNTTRYRFTGGNWNGSAMTSDMHCTLTVEATTDKSKTSITNVPVGTRYEETDTRKIFRRKHTSADTAWTQTTNNDGINIQYGTSNQTSKLGQKFETSHANVGKTFTQVTIRMKRYTAGGGNASASHILYCKVYDSSGSARATATTTYVYSTLATSYADKTFTFATPITIAANEIVGFESNGGAYDVETFNLKVNSSSTESNTKMIDYRNGGWSSGFDSWEMMMTLSTPASDSWVEKGTA